MTEERRIPASDGAWDSGELGRNEEFAKISDNVDDSAIDVAMELIPVSIRLQKSLIEDFKMIAKHNGVGYQPLMRQVLTRFAVAETRQMANDLLAEQKKRDLWEKSLRDERKRA